MNGEIKFVNNTQKKINWRKHISFAAIYVAASLIGAFLFWCASYTAKIDAAKDIKNMNAPRPCLYLAIDLNGYGLLIDDNNNTLYAAYSDTRDWLDDNGPKEAADKLGYKICPSKDHYTFSPVKP